MVSFKATSSDVLIERIDDKKVTVHYNLPVPSEGGKRQPVVVLPIDTPSGAEVTIGRTFDMVFNLTT